MKTARQWADEFCNRNVINVKGSEVQDFIKAVQCDALETAAQFAARHANEQNEILIEIRPHHGSMLIADAIRNLKSIS